MAEHDLVIRGGTIVDGSGGAPYVADIAIDGGIIGRIGTIPGAGETELDATGLIVTPGFVDIHTHYDGQAIWSERLLPSSQHGVTTVVTGNCGVGFAPCRPADHDILVSVMEGVEDIPEVVMTAGLSWDWETFPEYLDALAARPRDIDVAAYLPHSPLRVYVMGDRGARREPATPDDIARMQELLREAIGAGALGFATSRLGLHRTGAGANIPSFRADDSELLAMGDVLRELDSGVIQAVLDSDDQVYAAELALIEHLAASSERPVTFTLAQRNGQPDAWREVLDRIRATNEGGTRISAQIFPRPIGLILGLDTTLNPFSLCPGYAPLQRLPLAERVRRMRAPDVRRTLLAETPGITNMPLFTLARDFERIFPLRSALDYEPRPESSIAARARAAGIAPEEVAYDLLLQDEGHALLYTALANYAQGTLDPTLEMIRHPDTLIALGDGGAHYGVVCDASYPTFVLTHWTRDREGGRISLPEAIEQLARKPAQMVGLHDRGLIAAGHKADINLIDVDRLQLPIPHVVQDLPGGGRRLMQDAEGYVATIVSGVVIQREGAATGALPGRLVRGQQQPVA